jgi:hypothetical protein
VIRLTAIASRVLGWFGPELRSWIEFHSGHRAFFDPWGGAMNGQTARLEIVRALIDAVRPVRIIETGTYRGTTTEWFAGLGIPVVTIEEDERRFWFASRRLERFRHVSVIHGSSVAVLGTIPTEREPVFCYLDAHRDANLPLRGELLAIFERMPRAVVLIDDFAIPDDPGYGYGDYGPGAVVSLEYLKASGLPDGACLFFPAVPSSQESGHRRGAALLTADPQFADLLAATPRLRPWPLFDLRRAVTKRDP